MSGNTLITKSGGQTISEDDVNQYKTALTQDLVPRASSGIPTDVAGSLGTTLLRWLKGWFGSIGIGDPDNNNTIDEDGTELRFSADDGIQIDINTTPLGSGIDADGINRDMLRKYEGHQLSSSCGDFATYSTSLTDVTNLTVTITTKGGPVVLALNGESSAASSGTASYFRSNSTPGEITIDRDGTDIRTSPISATDGGGSHGFYHPGFLMLDTPSAGTYTYKIRTKQFIGTNTVQFRFLKLAAYEL